VLVLDVADVITSRLGKPTVTALARRYGPDGKCLTCGELLGTAPVSVRAYRDDQEIITLVAYHAGCANSAWLDVGSAILPCPATWAAAMATASLSLGAPRRFWRLRGPGTRDQTVPVMLVHPSLDMARVRQVGAGEAVNADFEGYCQRGFAHPSALARTYPLRPVGNAWMRTCGNEVAVMAMTGDRAWSAPVHQRPIADLVTRRGGVLIAITCDCDPVRLSTDARFLGHALGAGEILLGWASLSGSLGGKR